MSGHAIVYKTFDPGLADMLAGMLEQDGISARVTGARGSNILGAGQLLLETCIEVDAEQAERARLLVAELLNARGEDSAFLDEDTPLPARPLEPAAHLPERVSLLRALGVAPLIPGGTHLVARRPITGLILLCAQILGLVITVNGSYRTAQLGWLAFFGLLAFDLIFGALAVRAYNRGRRASGLTQVAWAAVALVGIYVAASALAPMVARWKKDKGAGGEPSGPMLRNGPGSPNDNLPPLLRTDILNPAL
jgi:hypothetical protein